MTADDGEIRFDDQTVLVTGGGRGIGRGHALLFAERGAHVIVNDVDRAVANEVVEEIGVAGGRATAAPGDVVDDAEAIVGVALDAGGRLDALVNNAGIAWDRPLSENATVETERLLRVHVLGTVALTTSAWPALIEARGRVVNTSSGAVIGLRHATAYAAAKGAILGFTRSLAAEAAEVGVRVNAIMPMARTRMYELAGGEVGSPQDHYMAEYFPAEAIAPAVVFLASDAVSYNGQVIETSGGTTAHVLFVVTPYLPATTPEEARDSLAASVGDLTVVHELSDMLAVKLSMETRSPVE
ncbi:MAG TPA: SDR family NAD(P)-dependent oxidoreductase [Acidimicrobiia bacterium]